MIESQKAIICNCVYTPTGQGEKTAKVMAKSQERSTEIKSRMKMPGGIKSYNLTGGMSYNS